MATKTWFITGTSRGFGRIWAEAALKRGDRVAATARRLETLDALVEQYGDAVLPLKLDVTDRAAAFAAVQQAADHFGTLDVVINNAGYGLFGAIEEVSEQQARDQLETNVFGALWVTQAALPILRGQGHGHIIQVSSIGGVTAFANIGLYNASKWALEGFSQSLAAEVKPFGIDVTLVEPRGFDTDWSGPSSVHADPIEAYEPARQATLTRRASNPQAEASYSAAALMRVVDADEPPLRVFFGEGPLEAVRTDYESRLATWTEWNDVSLLAEGKLPQGATS